jgi:NAD(P)-dependent dehydrogenase (short-subunit alcohol dehydrogenase family)
MRAVFITGGTTGIGLELAKLYLQKGWKVGVCARDRKKFEENFSDASDNVIFYPADVANRLEVKGAIADFAKSYGLDLVIANAGMGYKVKSRVRIRHTLVGKGIDANEVS